MKVLQRILLTCVISLAFRDTPGAGAETSHHTQFLSSTELRNVRAPATRYVAERRAFVADGDVMIGALLPITRAPGRSGPCTKASFHPWLNMHFFEPFLFVLRTYNFSLTARRPNGTRAQLSVGFIAADQCRNGDLTDDVKFALDITATKPTGQNGNFPQARCKGDVREKKKKPVLGLVGPWLVDRKVSAIAPLMAAYKIPQIVPDVARDEFSCIVPSENGTCLLEDDYQYLFRTGSSDRYLAYGAADILRHFNWTHFAVIAADDITNRVSRRSTFVRRQCGARSVLSVTHSEKCLGPSL